MGGMGAWVPRDNLMLSMLSDVPGCTRCTQRGRVSVQIWLSRWVMTVVTAVSRCRLLAVRQFVQFVSLYALYACTLVRESAARAPRELQRTCALADVAVSQLFGCSLFIASSQLFPCHLSSHHRSCSAVRPPPYDRSDPATYCDIVLVCLFLCSLLNLIS